MQTEGEYSTTQNCYKVETNATTKPLMNLYPLCMFIPLGSAAGISVGH